MTDTLKNQKILMKAIEQATENYLESQKRHEKRFPEKKENEKLKQFENYLKKAKKAYIELSEDSEDSIFRLHAGLKNSKNKDVNKLEKEILEKLISQNGILKPEKIKNILEVLENSAKQAQKEEYQLQKLNRTQQALFWLWGFSEEWEEYTDITLSEGRYDETLQKYDSPAIRILEELAPSGISNSILAEAIKLYRKEKEENKDLEIQDLV